MGFFDDDEDDDEDDQQRIQRVRQSSSQEIADDDEEDPLDAYMNSLQNDQGSDKHFQTTSNDRISHPNRQYQAATRLDLDTSGDEEDEEKEGAATNESLLNNWNNKKTNHHDDEEEEEQEVGSDAPSQKNSLQSMFVKANSENKKSAENSFLANIHLPQAGTLSTDTLSSMSRVFWEARDSERGRQWRKEHHIVLTSYGGGNAGATVGIGMRQQHNNPMESSQNNSMIDPIWKFEELLKASSSYDSDTQPKSSITALVEYLQTQFPNPTLVQSQTWSVALSGKDALITAATGQGKTFAYVVPMSLHCLWNQHRQHSDYDDDEGGLSDKIDVGPRGLVLVPTRELALQISKHAQPLLTVLSSSSSRYPLKCKAIIGGQGKYLLRQELKKNRGKLDFVIATPGRLLDVVSENRKKHGLSLQNVTFVVLDEADKMLHMGFEPQVRKILQSLRTDRQTLMLSATLGRKVEGLASEWLNPSAIRIAVGRTGEASEHVHQHVMVLPDPAAKAAFLIEMLPVFISVGRTLVFVKTREGCEQLAETITRETQPTIPILTLHGDKHQIDRNAAVRKFTGGEVQVIVATDVAARGLDIPHVQTVVCYDPAKDLDSHTHRVGRTGRLSANQSDGGTENQTSGSAYTLLTKNDADFAFVLRNAFQREGREVDTQLEALANSSRRAGNGTAIVCDNHKNKTGLGFVPFSTFRDDSTTSLSSPPPKRHRRWGPAR